LPARSTKYFVVLACSRVALMYSASNPLASGHTDHLITLGISLWAIPPKVQQWAEYAANSRNGNVLVIDDERLVISLTHAMLTRYGYTALTAISGAEAIQLFQNWPAIEVDLLLVDLVMPGMDGLEVVKRIAEMQPEIPVLFFSPYSARQDDLPPSFGREIPCIAKPFTSVQLIKKIREVLDAPKAEAAAK
jgi:CheY-like chemotaxis protein